MKGQRTWSEWDDDDSDDAYLGPDPDITGGAILWVMLALAFLVICGVAGFLGSLVF